MPDTWDDDWIAKGGSSTAETKPAPSSTKISKAERRAKQAEFNRQLWENAEDPQDNFFLKSRDAVPLKSEFKPAMKVLSRKPEKKSAAGVEGVGQLNIDDDDESEEENKKPVLTAEERREKAQRELEEKQKKYEEVKQRLFGNDQSTNSPSTTAASGSKRNNSKNSSPSRNQSWNKNGRDSRPSSSSSNKTGRLYDPNESSKAGVSSVLRKETKAEPDELQPIRSPRGPDTSGRGGFGFAPRGGKPA